MIVELCVIIRAYYDYEKGYIEYSCPYLAIQNKDYCIFHDQNYWKSHSEEVREEFYKLVEEAIVNNKELLCIGFHLPSFDINTLKMRGIKDIEFRKPVYFINAEFKPISLELCRRD